MCVYDTSKAFPAVSGGNLGQVQRIQSRQNQGVLSIVSAERVLEAYILQSQIFIQSSIRTSSTERPKSVISSVIGSLSEECSNSRMDFVHIGRIGLKYNVASESEKDSSAISKNY